MPYQDAIREAPPTSESAPDLWLRPDAVLAGMALEGEPIPTGWTPLDKYLRGGGIRPGRTIVVGGPPFTGKTTILAAMALHLSQRIRVFCLFADEGRAPAAARMGVMLGVPLDDIELDPLKASARVGEALGDRTIELLKPDRDECSLEAVAAYAESRVPRGEPAMLVFDSIQTIPVSATATKETDRVAKIERFMKTCREIADRTRFIVAASSWAPRAAYRSKQKSQNTEHIAGFHGGAGIEYGADVAIYLDTTPRRGVSEVDFVKNRLAPLTGPPFAPFCAAYDNASGRMLEIDAAVDAEQREAFKNDLHEKTISKLAGEIEREILKRGGLTGRQVSELVGGRHANVSEAIRGLAAQGVIEPTPGRGGGIVWRPTGKRTP